MDIEIKTEGRSHTFRGEIGHLVIKGDVKPQEHPMLGHKITVYLHPKVMLQEVGYLDPKLTAVMAVNEDNLREKVTKVVNLVLEL